MKTRIAILVGILAIVIVGAVAVDSLSRTRHDGGDAAADTRASATLATSSTSIAVSTTPVTRPSLPPIESGALRLEGQAVDDQQRPLGGATIELGDGRVTTTEADGSFAFDGLAAGSYTVIGELGALYGEAPGEVLDEQSAPVSVVLRDGPTLTVEIVRATDDTPIAGAKVEIDGRERITSASGIVELRGLAIGNYTIVATADGFARASDRISTGEDPTVEVRQTLRLGAGAAVAGIVVDERGVAVPEAMVRLEGARNTAGYTHTDERGHWQFDAIGAGHFTLVASSKLHIAADPPLVIELDGTPRRDVVVTVVAGGEITGIVVDASGKPIAKADVQGGGAAQSDDTGHFVLRGVEPGAVEVVAKTPLGASKVTKLELARGARADAGTLVVHEASIAGIVRDPDGLPVESVRVEARSTTDESVMEFAYTDEAGRFDFGGIARGEYALVVERTEEPTHTPARVAVVRTPARDVKLVIADPVKLVGRVVLDGKPVPYFGVVLVDQPDGDGSPDMVRAADGRFTRGDIPPGTWYVTIVGPDFRAKKLAGIRLTATSRTHDLGDIVVERGRSVTGRVVDEADRPIAGAIVSIGPRNVQTIDAASSGERWTRSDATGHYEITGLATTTGWTQYIVATHARGASQSREIPDDLATLDLRIEATGSIRGRVVNLPAFPARAPRSVFATRTTYAPKTYDGDIADDGTFTIDGLPVGDYELSLLQYTLVPVLVTVTSSATTTTTITLPAVPITFTMIARGCSLIYFRRAGALLSIEACTDGRAELDNVAPGLYEACIEDVCRPFDILPAPAIQTLTRE